MNYITPLLIGMGTHVFIHKVLPAVFPLNEDAYIGHVFRRTVRETWQEQINECSDKVKRIWRVVIPDNAGMASGIFAAYIIYNKYSISYSEIPIIIGMILTKIAALHFFREQICWRILGPVAFKNLPNPLNIYVNKFFQSVGPSDLQPTT